MPHLLLLLLLDREQSGYEAAQLRIFQRRRYDGYVTFDTAEAASAAIEVRTHGVTLGRGLGGLGLQVSQT
jgi:hypothetical protein